MYQKNQKHDPNGHHLNKSYFRAAFKSVWYPKEKTFILSILANIFILPIVGKYCKFYQYWARLRRKAICRSQKLRQHILSIAFLSLLMSSAVRNCPWFMMFYLSHLHDDILHLFPAAAVYTNFMMIFSTCFQLHVCPATLGRLRRWSQQLGHGEASCSGGYEAQVYSVLFDRVWDSFFFSFILFILENRPSMIVRPPVPVDTRLRWYFLTFQIMSVFVSLLRFFCFLLFFCRNARLRWLKKLRYIIAFTTAFC